MKKIGAICLNTFREAVKDKVFCNLLFFAILVIGLSVLIGNLAIGEDEQVIQDISLAAMSLFGVLIAVMVGISLVYKEIDRRTIYTVITKPIRRYEFLLGKYLGLLLTLLINVGVMTIALFLVIRLQGYTFNLEILWAIVLIFFELALITAIAILFSTFASPAMSAAFTFCFYLIGHLTQDLLQAGRESQSVMFANMSRWLYYLLPNLDLFNIRGEMVRAIPVSMQYITYSIFYGVLYASALLLLAMLIFQRREFN